MTTDITKSTLPKNKDWGDMAEDLLARFPGVDRAELLKKMVARCFFDMRYGNKQEERAACNFLNEVQVNAHKLQPATAEPANIVLDRQIAKTEVVNEMPRTTFNQERVTNL